MLASTRKLGQVDSCCVDFVARMLMSSLLPAVIEEKGKLALLRQFHTPALHGGYFPGVRELAELGRRTMGGCGECRSLNDRTGSAK
jgi:hypothetical protein